MGYCETYDLQFQRKGLEIMKVNQKLLELLEFALKLKKLLLFKQFCLLKSREMQE